MRKRVENVIKLSTWEEVNTVMRQIGECDRMIETAEHTMQERIAAAKEAAEVSTKIARDTKEQLETQLALFAESHRDDMGDRKSKALLFGSLGFRKSTSISLPRAATRLQEIMRALKAKGMHDCIVSPPEKIDKNALAKYPANDIMAVGAGIDVKDTFWYEIDRDKLKEVT